MISPAFAGSEKQMVTIAPEKPAVGAEITIRYNPMVIGAPLFGAEAVDVQVLVLREKETPLLLEAAMKKAGKSWEAKLKLEDAKSLFGLVRFASAKTADNNQDKYWDFLIHDQSGKPVSGAHLARSQSYLYPSTQDFRREKNLARAREEAMQEETLHPKQRNTKFRLWEIDLAERKGDSTLVRSIADELEVMEKESASDDEALVTISSWYRRVEQSEKAQALQDQLIAKNPAGDIARQVRFQKIFQTRDREERAKLALAYVQDFPNLEANQKVSIINLLINLQKFDKAEELLATLQPPNGGLLNNLAWPYIEQMINVPRGVELAKQGVEALRQPNPEAKPSFMSPKQWEQQRLTTLGYTLDTYAFGLFKLGRYQEAQAAYRESYDLTEGSLPDVNERLVQCYLQNGEYALAVEVTKTCIEKSKYNDKLLEYGKEAFTKKEGSAEGFERFVAAAKEAGAKKAKAELLAKRVNKPAIDFEAKNLQGEVVKLAQLKGKVVVLDFWATWCGPCKQAFPYVQKVYEKYKDNPDVVILAVNTWENESGFARQQAVKKFLEENKYTFPVVYDESGVVEKYKVEGIPTQFFIDRKGVIQFKTVGFEGPGMEPEMAMKIDMLLSGELLSAK
jgi:thiol-disulfide isomerase/thioredoxin